jgi:hypothetical protein
MALTDNAKKALAELKLAPAKATAISGFLEVYWTPRTNEDKEQAYRAMLKTVSAATLNPVLKKHGRGYVAPLRLTGAKALERMGVPPAEALIMQQLAQDLKLVKGKVAKDMIKDKMEEVGKKHLGDVALQTALKNSGLI